jgi:hypothetical protein
MALAIDVRPEWRRARSCVARNFSKRSAQRTEVESSRDLSRVGRSEKVDDAGVVTLSGQIELDTAKTHVRGAVCR